MGNVSDDTIGKIQGLMFVRESDKMRTKSAMKNRREWAKIVLSGVPHKETCDRCALNCVITRAVGLAPVEFEGINPTYCRNVSDRQRITEKEMVRENGISENDAHTIVKEFSDDELEFVTGLRLCPKEGKVKRKHSLRKKTKVKRDDRH